MSIGMYILVMIGGAMCGSAAFVIAQSILFRRKYKALFEMDPFGGNANAV